MFKLFRNVPNSYKIYDYIPSTKKIKHISYPVYNQYETIDFNFNPKHTYKLKVIEKTKFRIPKVDYEKQYESRDF